MPGASISIKAALQVGGVVPSPTVTDSIEVQATVVLLLITPGVAEATLLKPIVESA